VKTVAAAGEATRPQDQGIPVKLSFKTAQNRLKEVQQWAEKSKQSTGLVGQSEPRF